MAKLGNNGKVRTAILRLLVALDDEKCTNSMLSHLLWEIYLDKPLVVTLHATSQRDSRITLSPKIPYTVVFEPRV